MIQFTVKDSDNFLLEISSAITALSSDWKCELRKNDHNNRNRLIVTRTYGEKTFDVPIDTNVREIRNGKKIFWTIRSISVPSRISEDRGRGGDFIGTDIPKLISFLSEVFQRFHLESTIQDEESAIAEKFKTAIIRDINPAIYGDLSDWNRHHCKKGSTPNTRTAIFHVRENTRTSWGGITYTFTYNIEDDSIRVTHDDSNDPTIKAIMKPYEEKMRDLRNQISELNMKIFEAEQEANEKVSDYITSMVKKG